MSLLEEAMEECVMIDKVTRPDGYGGFIIDWTEGAHFHSAIVFNNSIEALQAQAAGVTALYTITTKKTVNLQYHDVFKRLSDGKTFRVKSDGDDKHTPQSAALNMRQVNAEEFVIPAST